MAQKAGTIKTPKPTFEKMTKAERLAYYKEQLERAQQYLAAASTEQDKQRAENIIHNLNGMISRM